MCCNKLHRGGDWKSNYSIVSPFFACRRPHRWVSADESWKRAKTKACKKAVGVLLANFMIMLNICIFLYLWYVYSRVSKTICSRCRMVPNPFLGLNILVWGSYTHPEKYSLLQYAILCFSFLVCQKTRLIQRQYQFYSRFLSPGFQAINQSIITLTLVETNFSLVQLFGDLHLLIMQLCELEFIMGWHFDCQV